MVDMPYDEFLKDPDSVMTKALDHGACQVLRDGEIYLDVTFPLKNPDTGHGPCFQVPTFKNHPYTRLHNYLVSYALQFEPLESDYEITGYDWSEIGQFYGFYEGITNTVFPKFRFPSITDPSEFTDFDIDSILDFTAYQDDEHHSLRVTQCWLSKHDANLGVIQTCRKYAEEFVNSRVKHVGHNLTDQLPEIHDDVIFMSYFIWLLPTLWS